MGKVGKMLDAIGRAAQTVDRKMRRTYQLEDEVFRMAMYLRERERGTSAPEAARHARDQFLNYDIRAPWINAMRRTALPFLSYTYRAVPVIAKSIAHRPWKLAKYATLAYLANELAYALSGGDEDEERRSLREQEQGYTWIGAPRMMRTPWADDYGNPIFLDIRRWIPAGDVFDTNQGSGAIPILAPLQFSGPLVLAAEVALNKVGFTGDEISNPLTDTTAEKFGKVADHIWKSWMPSAAWIPGSWYWEKIGNAATGARDMMGRPYSLGGAALSSIGIKAKPHDVELGFYWHMREFNRVERELKAQLRSLARDRERDMISADNFDLRAATIVQKLERLGDRRDETFRGPMSRAE